MRLLPFVLAALFTLTSPVARACEVALVLAIDVSNSVDAGEYRLQAHGLAEALLDPGIADTLVEGRMALAVLQWSGTDRQETTLPWRRMNSHIDVLAFSAAARAMPRAFTLSDTAPGDAILAAMALFAEVPDCARRVIDVSGDGAENAGSSTVLASRAAHRAGIEINGLAIESIGLAITQFYRRAVVTPGGFVVTARTHTDYARAIREKIRREISRVSG
jgi:Ca-activated chloride channel family protein